MNPNRNPSEERLLAYAAGSLSPPEAVVVAAHLALRPANDAWVHRLQAVGGEFLEEAAPVALTADALSHAMALIETDAGEAQRHARTARAAAALRPRALALDRPWHPGARRPRPARRRLPGHPAQN